MAIVKESLSGKPCKGYKGGPLKSKIVRRNCGCDDRVKVSPGDGAFSAAYYAHTPCDDCRVKQLLAANKATRARNREEKRRAR